MIKGNELTIGALVRSNNDYAKVTALYKEDDGIHVEGNVFCGDDSSPEDIVTLIPDGLTPVSLTERLLETNGWKKMSNNPITYVHPSLGEENKVVFEEVPTYRGFEVQYVHHFQNLLAIANNHNVDIDLQRLCK
jgi:hypothetical protein